MPRRSSPPQRTSTPESLAKTLAQLKRWPNSWKTDDADVAFGEDLIRIFEEFLTELYLQGLSTRTINRHKGNLWVLGGELIRRRSTKSVPCSWPAMTVLGDYISEDGGPLLPSRTSDGDQQSFDATCRKLFDLLPEAPGEQHAPKTEA